MKQLNLVIPGLLGPFSDEVPAHIKQQLKQADFKVINSVLSRADLLEGDHGNGKSDWQVATSYYETLVQLINPQYQQSLCQLTAKYDGIDLSEGYFYRADPVHYKAESDHAILIGPELVLPEAEEVKQLIRCFNQHFSEDNLTLHATDTCRWYLKTDRPLKLEFSALDYALGRDIKHFMPSGEDALWWRKMLNEAQMLFFQHEVNSRREEKGKLGINGLWLWDMSFNVDCGDILSPEQIFSNEVLAAALGDQSGLAVLSVDNIDEIKSTAILVLDQLYEAVCYGDIDAWFKSLNLFCNDEFQRVINLLLSKKIDEINIYPCNGQVFNINRMKLLKFWKSNKILYKYMVVS